MSSIWNAPLNPAVNAEDGWDTFARLSHRFLGKRNYLITYGVAENLMSGRAWLSHNHPDLAFNFLMYLFLLRGERTEIAAANKKRERKKKKKKKETVLARVELVTLHCITLH